MSIFVVDASVVIKWVIEEDGSEDALRLHHHRLLAPALLVAECANILWEKVRRKELSADDERRVAGLLARTDVEPEPMRPLLERAYDLAISLKHPAYDCTDLALAESRGWALMTADESLIRKIAGGDALPEARILQGFGLS